MHANCARFRVHRSILTNRNLENNIAAVCTTADIIDVVVQNGQVAKLAAGRAQGFLWGSMSPVPKSCKGPAQQARFRRA